MRRCGKSYKIIPAFKDIQKFCSQDCYKKYRVENGILLKYVKYVIKLLELHIEIKFIVVKNVTVFLDKTESLFMCLLWERI